MLAGLLVLTLVGCSLAQGTVDPSLVETVFGPQSSNPDPSVLECTNDKGETGICVDIPLCNTDHGYGKVQMRATLGDCSSYLEICCTPAEVLKAPLVPLPPALKEGCGLHQPQGVGFEIEGHTDGEAQFGEFPWMVVIMKKLEKQNKTYNQYVCGGSLIHPSVVVTAAHSITPDLANDLSHLVARAGEWDAQTAREMLRHQNRPIRSIVKHEEHLPSAVFNDVALLFLDEPMDLSPHIGVICLPPPGEYPPPANCFASGWGKNRFDEAGRYQTILKKIELPIVSKSNCEMSLRKTRLGLSFHLHKSFTCAGGIAGQDTCTGDGGSPLACPISDTVGRYMLAGIVAWGIGCGDEGIPGVYSNVPYLRQWIDSKLMLNGIDMSPFRA